MTEWTCQRQAARVSSVSRIRQPAGVLESAYDASPQALPPAVRCVHLGIRNLVNELHKRMAKWLCKSHKVFFLRSSKSESSQVVAKKKPGVTKDADGGPTVGSGGPARKLNSKTVRAMLT